MAGRSGKGKDAGDTIDGRLMTAKDEVKAAGRETVPLRRRGLIGRYGHVCVCVFLSRLSLLESGVKLNRCWWVSGELSWGSLQQCTVWAVELVPPFPAIVRINGSVHFIRVGISVQGTEGGRKKDGTGTEETEGVRETVGRALDGGKERRVAVTDGMKQLTDGHRHQHLRHHGWTRW